MKKKLVEVGAETLLSELRKTGRTRLPDGLRETVRAMNSELKIDPDKPVDQNHVYSELERCRAWLEAHGRKCARAFTELEWLWYLRRSTAVFEGNYRTTETYRRAVAETLSALFGASQKTRALRIAMDDIHFDVSPKSVRRVIDLIIAATLLSDVHGKLRWCGKGADFVFDGLGLLKESPATSLEDAVRLYDQRADSGAGPGLLTMAGTVVGDLPDKHAIVEADILAIRRVDPFSYEVEFDPGVMVDIPVRYVWIPYSLAQLGDLTATAGRNWWSPTSAAVLTLLMCAREIMLNSSVGALRSLMEYGYLPVFRDVIASVLANRQAEYKGKLSIIVPGANPPATVDDLLNELGTLKPSLWPLKKGNPLIPHGDRIFMDLLSATDLLAHLFEFPRESDALGNMRASHFELAAQETLNKSPWAPSKELLSLRGRSLIIEGKEITDIDAIGERGDTLLLVDCISLLNDAAYDTGQPSKVKSAADKIEDKTNKWATKVAQLSVEVKGDNFDFSKYKNLVGVVCSPEVFYVPIGPCTKEVTPGLLAASSLFELNKFVHS